jgi:AraC-like DNA-binding protein
MNPSAAPMLLSNFPLLRSQQAEEASNGVGKVFSPHRLQVCGPAGALDMQHNQIKLRDVSVNVLRYGAEVLIDPGCRGDSYIVQLPLQGWAQLRCGGQSARVDAQVLSVLAPQEHSQMHWSPGCTMLLLHMPRQVVERRFRQAGLSGEPRMALSKSRESPEVAAWWQAVLDLAANLDRFGQSWLRQPLAAAAMEEFLLSSFMSLFMDASHPKPVHGGLDNRSLQRAKAFIEAHLHRAVDLHEIARAACIGPRALETLFKRHEGESPLIYARHRRLEAVHQALSKGDTGTRQSVSNLALDHGFTHMGRFAAQYRARFGCSPSETLRPRKPGPVNTT